MPKSGGRSIAGVQDRSGGLDMRRIARAVGLGLLGAALVVAPVSAGKPESERVPIDEVFVDDELSAACGVTVNAHVLGHITFRLFGDADGDPVREVNNYATRIQWWSVNGEIHAQDVGADRVAYLDDDSVVVIIIGSVQSFSIPGEGRVYSDVGRSMLVIDANADATFTPLGGQHDADQLAAICGVLG
jgi:hypothetical protein